MRKNIILSVCLSIAIVAILFVVLRPGTSPAVDPGSPLSTENPVGKDSANPEDFVASFYAWYLVYLSEDGPVSQSEFEKLMEPWLTKELIAAWHDPETEGDPVLPLSAEPSSLQADIVTSLVSQTGDTSVVSLTLSLGNISVMYDVSLVKNRGGGTWRIDSVTPTREN